MQLTILMPCLNEAETLGACIRKANAWIARSGIEAEVVIADSTDARRRWQSLGVRVVQWRRWLRARSWQPGEGGSSGDSDSTT
jgi:glycosyltransferase involved in cell wall biosynthesis